MLKVLMLLQYLADVHTPTSTACYVLALGQ